MLIITIYKHANKRVGVRCYTDVVAMFIYLAHTILCFAHLGIIINIYL